MSSARILALAASLVWLAVFLAALATVHARHDARKLFGQLQQLEKQRDELDIDWGRLRLEQSAYATHGMIERVARDDLGMSVPAPEDIVIVRKP